MISLYFGSLVSEKCEKCDNCLSTVVPLEIDFTLHAKQLVSCLQHIMSIKDKVSVDDLALTYIGSKSATVKSNKLDQVPEHGKGKGNFK